MRALVLACAVCAFAARAVGARDDANVPCAGCQLSVGVGGTYDYFDKTGGIVAPFALDFGHGRWELAAFRFATAQYLEPRGASPARRFTNPYWGASLSYRFGLWTRPSLRVFLGLGTAWKSETDRLNSTEWNLAEQLGVRWRLSNAWALELTVRHWSNAGLKLPNRGQDFATLTLVF